jgi:hypothetical protein
MWSPTNERITADATPLWGDIPAKAATFYCWGRRIGWKNISKLWLEERTPEQLKGGGT